MYGYEPREYPSGSLRCVCGSCHENRGVAEQVFRSYLAQLTTGELETLTQIIDSALLRYDRRTLFQFLSSLSEFEGDPNESLKNLRNIIDRLF